MKKQRMLAIALAGLLSAQFAMAATPAAAPARVDGFTFVKQLDGIQEYTLDSNGLSVLILPSHVAPVVTYQVTYRVGSRNEAVGTTGGTHLLEHLMFKGSKAFNKEQKNGVDNYLELHGAEFNATTSFDRTNYYASLSPDALEGYVAIEADRMRNLLLRKKDLDDEMTVVRNEYEQNENNPAAALQKDVWAAAYQAHPYHHPIIGWRSDIENVPMEKLKAFYDTFYWPNNATVTIVGDVQPEQALSLVKKYYGSIPRSSQPIPTMYTTEPPQQGARRVTVSRAAQLGTINMLFKGPNGLHADAMPLSMLALLLSSGENSRLYKSLVDTSVATDVNVMFNQMHDPGAFTFSVGLAPAATHADVERRIWEQIEKIKRDGVTTAEIERVMGPFRAEAAYRRDGTAGAAATLNEYIAIGDWTAYVTDLDKLAKVSPADVKRVANQYLVKDQSTTGWFVPETKQ